MTRSGQNAANKRNVASHDSSHIHILLADDHALMRQALTDVLEMQDGFMVVAQASTGGQAVQLASKYKPHVVLMDVSMPEMNGIDATAQIRNKLPNTRIIGLSMNNDSYTGEKMISAGADAFLTKTKLSGRLVQIIRRLTQ